MTMPLLIPSGPAQEGFAEGTDGTRIFFEVWEPPPVAPPAPTFVLTDGIGCDGFAWKYITRHFQKKHRIVHWHYRGHGKSGLPRDRERTTFDDLCGDLAAVLAASRTERGVFFGHSMGVQLSLEYHRRHAAQVEALVLALGSHGMPLDTFHDSHVLRTVVPVLDRVARRFPTAMALTWRTLVRSEFAYQVATRLEVNGPLIQRADMAPYFEHLSGVDPRLFFSILRHAGRHSAYDHLPKVDVPTLIIAGTKDSFTPYWLSEERADRIPGAEMLTVPGGTHAATIEQPELIQLRLERFLEELGSAKSRGAQADHPVDGPRDPGRAEREGAEHGDDLAHRQAERAAQRPAAG
jgi:pimeloyl-ACP methyl ester carboxylesterase